MNRRLPLPLVGLCRVVAVGLAGLVLAACSGSDDAPVTVGAIGSGATLDDEPWQMTAPDMVLRESVAQGLVRFDARGLIEPGLAERWNVSNDGLNYIFRLQTGQWSDGRAIRSRDVARLLKQQLAATNRNPIGDALGAVDDVVAMTDRVIEISLVAPRPNLLQLLAQPEMTLVSAGAGSGPFTRRPDPGNAKALILERKFIDFDDDRERIERVRLVTTPARGGVNAFANGRIDLLLGGTIADLPYALALKLPRGSLHFDPVTGLFGLVPARTGGPIGALDLRRLVARAIDRNALIAALGVDGLVARATLLQAGLDGVGAPVQPEWLGQDMATRFATLKADADRLFGKAERPTLALALPDGPGAEIVFSRLSADLGLYGIKVVRAGSGVPADLRLVDRVAPSTSPAWFVREFRCGRVALCDQSIGALLEDARTTTDSARRGALLAQAAAIVDDQQLLIPIAAPIRWSLVSKRVPGFRDNLFARHSLSGLGDASRGGG